MWKKTTRFALKRVREAPGGEFRGEQIRKLARREAGGFLRVVGGIPPPRAGLKGAETALRRASTG